MTKKLLLIILSIFSLNFIGCKQEGDKMNTTEIVIYRIKSEKFDRYNEISALADKFLKTRKGFIRRITKQDHKDKMLFVDIVEWQTLEDALSASQAAEKEASLKPFFEDFEKIISFNHFKPFSVAK